jgi:two-component system chemotaxis response regulator CheB
MFKYQLNPERIVRDVVVIGASAGGLRAVSALLAQLPANLPAMLGVVIHRGARSSKNWASLFEKHTPLHVVEPVSGTPVAHGFVYIGPSDHHMTFRDGAVFLDQMPKEHHTRPAVDPLFESAALTYASRVLGIVMTGGGFDGAAGLLRITNAGGLSLVQNPAEADHASMPRFALHHDDVSGALKISELGKAIIALAQGQSYPSDPSFSAV